MKTGILLFVFLFACSYLSNAQEKYAVPHLTDEQKTEVLFSHVIAYAATGISFAKDQGVNPKDYGKFIGKKFVAFWNPDDGFPMLVNRMMFILAGMYANNEMQILKQSEDNVTFRLRNVDVAFQQGPMFDVTYQDFLDCSEGIISVIAKHMHAKFSHEMTDDGWYVATFSK